MKITNDELKEKAIEAINSCLSRVSFLKIEDVMKETLGEGVKPDLLVKLRLPEGEKNLLVEIKSNGQPRVAREAVNQILRYRDLYPGVYGVFVAPYISPKAARICTEEEIGHVDLVGNCRLCFGQVHIEREGKPNLFAEKRDLRSLYSPKAERVLRVLLSDPKKAWRIVELAQEAQVSLGQVSNVKKLLMDREWIEIEASGFFLSEPDQLLRQWGDNYSFRRNRVRDFYSLKSLSEIETDLGEICSRMGFNYVFTGFSGAARYSPAVRYQRAIAYVGQEEEKSVSQLGVKEVTSGANLSLLSPYDEGVFYGSRVIDSLRIAAPIQIYLDLQGFRGRGKEAAQVLLDQVIRPSW